ncbi:MAG: hypothetical protein LAP39_25320 [Acidobacteriia bacterium]|nr:hypothetical protein [Terriglobia bacterium]
MATYAYILAYKALGVGAGMCLRQRGFVMANSAWLVALEETLPAFAAFARRGTIHTK